MTTLSGVDLAAILHSEMSPGLRPVTLTTLAATSRTPGNLTGGINATETEYQCRGVRIENDGARVAGELVGRDEAIVLIIANSIAAGTVTPKVNDKVTYESGGTTKTRPITRIGEDAARAAWLCVVRG